ncbi:MAG: OmpA family protein [Pseudomonadota bacterium]
MSESTQNTQVTRAESTRRYTRRRSEKGLAFFPFGWIPIVALVLLLLFALFPFASLWIEENAEQAASSAVRSGGEAWAEVSASGQWITLTGEAPSAERAAKAIDLVRSARAPAMFGRARPATRVIDRTTIAGDARTLEPTNDADEPRGLSEASAQDPRDVCDQSLKTLLRESKIKFSVASAQIAPASNELLDQLARAVTACALPITIQGHTDSTGSASFNDGLSLSRAESVRAALIARGVSEELLDAEGYGAARPIADNDTPGGREANRRIEFIVHAIEAAQD